MPKIGRSREGAWIEILLSTIPSLAWNSRSREGAWIEMQDSVPFTKADSVAPARERGLKLTPSWMH